MFHYGLMKNILCQYATVCKIDCNGCMLLTKYMKKITCSNVNPAELLKNNKMEY
jgi:hypothetical protein